MTSFRDLFGRKRTSLEAKAISAQNDEPPPSEILVEGVLPFAAGKHIEHHQGYPFMPWDDVRDWLTGIDLPDRRSAAWREAQRAWLHHMRGALGPRFHLRESKNTLLLSSLEPNIAAATLNYMERTLQRVVTVLDGVAQMPGVGKEVLIVFDDVESYYRYAAYYYPNEGEFAFSSGLHIDAGCSHYVTVKDDLRLIEPVIAHEMTHGCLGHLPLPAWLNEGLAVNVERRLSPTPPTHTPQQLHAKHLAFWDMRCIQEFWCGRSFLRTDDGNFLSYDLASLMVDQLSRPWEPFKQFVLAADCADAGSAAARQHLGVDLGEVVCALLEQALPAMSWEPDPAQWQGDPERGRFAGK